MKFCLSDKCNCNMFSWFFALLCVSTGSILLLCNGLESENFPVFLTPWWLDSTPPTPPQCAVICWLNTYSLLPSSLSIFVFMEYWIGCHMCYMHHILTWARCHVWWVMIPGFWTDYGVCGVLYGMWGHFTIPDPCLCFCVQMQGRFIPSCDEDGYYRKQQCDRGECWCVDQNGGEVAGSRIRGKPDCGKSHKFQLSVYMNRIWTWKLNLAKTKISNCLLWIGPALHNTPTCIVHKASFMLKEWGPLQHNSLQGLVTHSCVRSHLHSKALLVAVRSLSR